jgi:hypothetical protein
VAAGILPTVEPDIPPPSVRRRNEPPQPYDSLRPRPPLVRSPVRARPRAPPRPTSLKFTSLFHEPPGGMHVMESTIRRLPRDRNVRARRASPPKARRAGKVVVTPSLKFQAPSGATLFGTPGNSIAALSNSLGGACPNLFQQPNCAIASRSAAALRRFCGPTLSHSSHPPVQTPGVESLSKFARPTLEKTRAADALPPVDPVNQHVLPKG